MSYLKDIAYGGLSLVEGMAVTFRRLFHQLVTVQYPREMMNLVISGSMLQFFISWEFVGLASYFLIGFYYEKSSACQAGNKAFVMNRVGDAGFFLGLVLLVHGFGNLGIPELNPAASVHGMYRTVVNCV